MPKLSSVYQVAPPCLPTCHLSGFFHRIERNMATTKDSQKSLAERQLDLVRFFKSCGLAQCLHLKIFCCPPCNWTSWFFSAIGGVVRDDMYETFASTSKHKVQFQNSMETNLMSAYSTYLTYQPGSIRGHQPSSSLTSNPANTIVEDISVWVIGMDCFATYKTRI